MYIYIYICIRCSYFDGLTYLVGSDKIASQCYANQKKTSISSEVNRCFPNAKFNGLIKPLFLREVRYKGVGWPAKKIAINIWIWPLRWCIVADMFVTTINALERVHMNKYNIAITGWRLKTPALHSIYKIPQENHWINYIWIAHD